MFYFLVYKLNANLSKTNVQMTIRSVPSQTLKKIKMQSYRNSILPNNLPNKLTKVTKFTLDGQLQLPSKAHVVKSGLVIVLKREPGSSVGRALDT